jgi:hypothetical protein
MVEFKWSDRKKEKTTKSVKEDKNKDKMKYILIGVAIGIIIGIVLFYVLMASGIIQPLLRGFVRPRGFPGSGNFTRPQGFTRPS